MHTAKVLASQHFKQAGSGKTLSARPVETLFE